MKLSLVLLRRNRMPNGHIFRGKDRLAESDGHARELGKPEIRKQEVLDKSRMLFKNDVTLYERLKHLRVKESWD
ncbi:hypothetical protein K1T71_011170 [Dendrolimus kikuchii]|uniref:Uncharacterized protein n=1 Tax=Dendrolimus kikuchii TaxID=765133 RepID=A0ACC1CN26_9NEOP|nr:hypothetical protein K1T71_011170 [Dendrolimus kikuchii]